jgi:hypothetical protein
VVEDIVVEALNKESKLRLHGFHFMTLPNAGVRVEVAQAGSRLQACSRRHNLKPPYNENNELI